MPLVKVRHIPAFTDIVSQKKPREFSLIRVISGGQIGTDIAALRAAKKSKIKTGGYMPEGFITLTGPKRGYGWMYNLIDDVPPFSGGGADYKTRTWKNVLNSDATLRLAWNFDSPGERCTLNAIRHYCRPHLDSYMEPGEALPPSAVAAWILANEIQVLNVAGNSNIALEPIVENYLMKVFHILRFGKERALDGNTDENE